jgi:hypothetical protein
MTGDAEAATGPTPTAMAAKAFMERIDNLTYLGIIGTRAKNGGWVGARAAGLRDARASDAVALAAVEAVLDLFRDWAAETDGAARLAAFTCPCCGATSPNPNDIREGYCGRCHWWTGDPVLGPAHLSEPCEARRRERAG